LVTIYIDGYSVSQQFGLLDPPSDCKQINVAWGPGNKNLEGKIADIKIYNVALSADLVQYEEYYYNYQNFG
jgi:hypothetical protein